LFCFIYIFWEKIMLCTLGWSQILHPPASASEGLRLQVWTTTPSVINFIFNSYWSICLCLFIRKVHFSLPPKWIFLTDKRLLSNPDVRTWSLPSGGLSIFKNCLPRRRSCFYQGQRKGRHDCYAHNKLTFHQTEDSHVAGS
jgi:hypothetical protein